jgi:hypothetical protein
MSEERINVSPVAGQVEHSEAPERLTKGLARHPVPIMLLASGGRDPQAG